MSRRWPAGGYHRITVVAGKYGLWTWTRSCGTVTPEPTATARDAYGAHRHHILTREALRAEQRTAKSTPTYQGLSEWGRGRGARAARALPGRHA